MIRSLLAVWLTTASGTLAAADLAFLTSAANVRLRDSNGEGATIVEVLPLGSRLAAAGRDPQDDWIPVRVLREHGPEGWIHSSLVVPVTESTFPEVAAGLIETRLAREGDGFGARRQLLDLVESTSGLDWNPDAKSRLALQRLQAIKGVLLSIPWNRDTWDESLRNWLVERSAEIRYNEPGGNWLLRPEVILAAHGAHRNTLAADEIAWLAVSNGLGGECEGNVVCYLKRLDRLHGEYLRREPDGSHVEDAVDHLVERVEDMRTRQHPDNGPAQYEFNAQSECAELRTVAATLESAARGSRATRRDELVASLRELSKPCA